MTNSAMNIFLRVVRRRLANGERLEDILASYPKLTESEKNEIRARINET